MEALADILRAMDRTAWALLVGAPIFILAVTAYNIVHYSKRLADRPREYVARALVANVDMWDFGLGVASLVLVFGLVAYLEMDVDLIVDPEDRRGGLVVLGIASIFPFVRRKLFLSRPPKLLPRNAWLRITSIVLAVLSVALAVVPLLRMRVVVAAIRGIPTDPPDHFVFVYGWMAAVSAAFFLVGAILAVWERRRCG